MGNTVQRPSVDYLPPEMVQEIFRYIPTSELLQTCRLVSNEWSQLATSMCRSRHVRVKSWKPLDYSSNFGVRRIFMNAISLPWTSVDLHFQKCPNENEFIEQLCEGFGSNVQFLKACIFSPGHYNHFFRALRHMPNLQKLEILLNNMESMYCGLNTCDSEYAHSDSEPEPAFSPFIFPPHGEIQLLQLKHLDINYDVGYDNFFEFLEFMLLNSGAQLKSLHLPLVNEYVSSDEFCKIVKLLCTVNATIPKLSLGIYYGHPEDTVGWKLLAQHRHFRIHKLHVFHADVEADLIRNENLRPLECFLANCIGLTSLSLPSFNAATPASKLKFPMLHDLKTLSIGIGRVEELPGDNNRDLHSQKFWFNPLQSRNFTNLESVSLGYSTSNRIEDIDLLFEAESFPRVKFLKVSYGCVGEGFRGRWSTVFPNVTKIESTIGFPGQIRSIVDGMGNVTELEIRMNTHGQTDNDALLHGVIEAILPLKALTKLTMRNWLKPYSGEYAENLALLLMQLHPLFLEIHDDMLNETNPAVICLREHHFGFVHFQWGRSVQPPPNAGSTAFEYIQLVKSRMILLGCLYLMHEFIEFLGW